ncbi:Glutamine-Leucine-Glutamine, QLQ [Cynara cardunculus var. scolymus]|uniref:Growth-regulating factor n=2 Tax=Cynara cardunculus var. scolymus TaxID=59895 RepID=A0A103XBI9_CYNCS|nr:Glutamine-Leucine-Glutamine, QLQ [Cynara cardunculus var. scolymus]
MAATLGFPFTAAQWKELERQAMIYKYMVASVPVPYQLLLPIIQNLPPAAAAAASASRSPLVSQLRYSTKQDLEPGRCKRTDGKKWRCSRDVAPNQKYCDRHMHRGRPRSRKHVELSKNPSPSSSLLPNKTPSLHSNPCKVAGSTILPSVTQPSLFLDDMQSNKRGSDWSTEQQWRQIMQTSRSIFNDDFGEEQPSFTDFGTSHDYLLSETPRRDFIDAWSTNKSTVIKDSSGDLSPSALDLSMAMALGNNGFGELGVCKVSGLVSPVSCGGGPLAEVLRPSLVGVCSIPTSPAGSSPSGVLQRTMPSVSDSSVCNSAIVAASSTPTDIVAFQWFT